MFHCSFSDNAALQSKIKRSLKRSYDFAKSQESLAKKTNALPELIIDNFDLEQIWQQIELQNEEVLDKNILHVSQILASKNLLFKKIEIPESGEVETNDEQPEADQLEVHENLEEESENVSSGSENNEVQSDFSENEKPRKTRKKSIVDDDFFKLEEMEEFLNKEEAALNDNKKTNDDSDSEASVDLFEANSSDDDRSKNPRYKDFFGSSDREAKQLKRNKFLEAQSDEDVEESELAKSTIELRDERLKRKIEDLEEEALSEKPWQLKGVITADKRPQNSLLEEIVDFDLTARPGLLLFFF